MALTVPDDPPAWRRDTVPRFAGAKAVDAAGFQRISHKKRRHDDDLDVPVWINAQAASQ